MPDTDDQRLTEALERLHEDESLTADLTDSSAEAVFVWLERELRETAEHDAQALDTRVASLRRAVKQAAREHGDDPSAVVAAAQALATSADGQIATCQATRSLSVAAAAPSTKSIPAPQPKSTMPAQRSGWAERVRAQRSRTRRRRRWSSRRPQR